MFLHATLRSPRTIYFGSGQRHALPQIVAGLGRRAFVCSDPRIHQDANLSEMMAALRGAGLAAEVYDGTVAELPLACIQEAAKQARAFKPDVVIGIGGGSCLDIAKLVALVLRHGDDLAAFYGEFKVPAPVLPVVAVPTTSGTGSECTPVAVLADPARQTKVGISSPHLIPEVAVCDPELTLSCPPGLTAIAGADALTHAIEAYTAIKRPFHASLPLQQVFIGKNAHSDAQARVAIGALANHLGLAVKNGSDLVAREQVMFGAMSAGLAFGVAGTAAAHAIQYPIGALTHTAHGMGVAALMPYVMQYNQTAATTEFADIARLFGAASDSDANLAEHAVDLVAQLFANIGIPATIADLGVTHDQLPEIAAQAMLAARLVNNNPRPLDKKTVLDIVTAAYHGDRQRLRLACRA